MSEFISTGYGVDPVTGTSTIERAVLARLFHEVPDDERLSLARSVAAQGDEAGFHYEIVEAAAAFVARQAA